MSSQLPLPSDRGFSLEGVNGAGYPQRLNGPPESGASLEQGIKRYLAAFYRYKWMILILLAIGTGVGFVLASRGTPVYQTRARVLIGVGLAGGQVGAPIRQGQLLGGTGWQQLLFSSAVLDSVVLQQKLYLHPTRAADSIAFITFSVGTRPRPGTYSLQADASNRTLTLTDATGAVVDRGAVGDSIGEGVGFRWVPDPANLPANRPLEFTVEDPSNVREELSDGRLSASDPEADGFMSIRLRGDDPARITAILTAIIERFEQVALEMKKTRLTENANILQTQLTEAEGVLATAENDLEAFKVQTITLPSERGVPINPGLTSTDASAVGNYHQLTQQKDQLSRDRESILRALERRQGAPDLVTALEIVPMARQSSALAQALNSATAADANIRTLKITFTEKHPEVQKQQVALDSLTNHVIPARARELAQELESREREFDQLIATSGAELQEIPQRSKMEMMLERRKAIAEELYRDLESRHQQARIAEVTTVPDMQILDKPKPQFLPVEDPGIEVLLMCMAGALGLGVLGAVLRDRFDPRLRYPDEVTGGMGLYILGAVPALRRGKLGATDMALAVEAFRAIQLSILHAHGAEAPLAITLTSPGAADGKSFVTANLAIAFADMGHRTLIIDGDVRRGTVHQLLGTTHKPGLTDYLAGHASRDDITQSTRYTLLDMIGCGSRGEAGPKLLGSSAMTKLMNELRDEYDVIVVDSPPLGACVDPMILGTLTRNLVLVLRTGMTDRGMAESKLQILDRLPVRVLGAVLNDVPARGPYRYYSYMSGYEVLDEAQVGQEVSSLRSGEDASPAAEKGTGTPLN